MIFYVVDATGKIMRTGSCPEKDFNIQAGAGETAYIVASAPNMLEQYRFPVTGRIRSRPEFDLSISGLTISVGETLLISGIPTGTVVDYVGGSEIVDDGDIEWSSEIAGEYEFVFQNFPYQAKVVKIEITEA
tara:strand:+ start:583 stop:978 length:396 start_codon:yes stop_codon:yes gene_type:complete